MIIQDSLYQKLQFNDFKPLSCKDGQNIDVVLQNGKKCKAKVLQCIDNFANVEINNKKYLINSDYKIINQI